MTRPYDAVLISHKPLRMRHHGSERELGDWQDWSLIVLGIQQAETSTPLQLIVAVGTGLQCTPGDKRHEASLGEARFFWICLDFLVSERGITIIERNPCGA